MIVLDTHVLVWLRTCPDRSRKAAAEAIRKELKSDCASIAGSDTLGAELACDQRPN